MNLRAAFDAPVPTVVLAEAEFGNTAGKTANGVVLESALFDAQAVIDSETAGQSPSDVLGTDSAPDVPIVASVAEALDVAPAAEAFVVGVATAGGQLPDEWAGQIDTAIQAGLDVVSGLHLFLSETERWQSLADEHGVRLFDVRKPPDVSELRVSDGRVDEVDADVVAVLGTDCAVGKRTTTSRLYEAARDRGLDAGWVATGQTGIMTGANRGVVVDRVPADFTAGIVEEMVTAVGRDHDLVFVEGQASLTHRAYSGVTLSILHGAWPDTAVLADDPSRTRRTHYEQFPVDGVDHERALVEQLTPATVAAVSTWGDPATVEQRHGVAAGNVYEPGGTERLLDAVVEALS